MKIKNLSFTFLGQQKPFFNNVSITLTRGRLIALTGHNGAGKSTLLKLLAGHLQGEQLEGDFLLNGVTYNVHATMPQDLINEIRLVQQDVDTMLASNLTAQENLQLASMLSHPRLTALPQVDRTTLSIELPFALETPVNELSGGQRQLLAILMALQQRPSVLLLDEPTAALDAKNAHDVMHALKQLAKTSNTFVLLVCHNPELVAEYADECIELAR